MRTLNVMMLVMLATTVRAQEAGRGGSATVYRLFPLEYISNEDASRLIAPFIPQSPYYGVFDAGHAVRGVTVRAPKEVIDRVDSLLKANDVAPPTVVLRFQIIAALDSNVTDAAIAPDVQNSLKDLFKFGGYRLIAQGSSTVGTRFGTSPFSVTMASEYVRFTLDGAIEDVRTRARNAAGKSAPTVELRVSLTSARNGVAENQRLLSTGLTAALGQTIVLGSAAAAGTVQKALILTVRPELLSSERR